MVLGCWFFFLLLIGIACVGSIILLFHCLLNLFAVVGCLDILLWDLALSLNIVVIDNLLLGCHWSLSWWVAWLASFLGRGRPNDFWRLNLYLLRRLLLFHLEFWWLRPFSFFFGFGFRLWFWFRFLFRLFGFWLLFRRFFGRWLLSWLLFRLFLFVLGAGPSENLLNKGF